MKFKISPETFFFKNCFIGDHLVLMDSSALYHPLALDMLTQLTLPRRTFFQFHMLNPVRFTVNYFTNIFLSHSIFQHCHKLTHNTFFAFLRFRCHKGIFLAIMSRMAKKPAKTSNCVATMNITYGPLDYRDEFCCGNWTLLKNSDCIISLNLDLQAGLTPMLLTTGMTIKRTSEFHTTGHRFNVILTVSKHP